MRFSQVNAVRVPNGNTRKIRHDGKVLWSPIIASYVSLGDSIAAGHTINSDWAKDYGEGSQYGKNGNTETAIVPNCYTYLIHKDLIQKYGGNVGVTSFARSGDTVDDLIEKLDHDVIKKAIAKAGVVTVCIGANNVLEPAMSRLEEYINAGESALENMTAAVDANLAILADDNNANSYTALFNKLSGINPNAKYVFMTIYNPYKYLWIDEGRDGFFGPLLDLIPQMTILGFEVDKLIKDLLLSQDVVELLYDRVNRLSSWAETNVTKLNDVMRNKISAYQSVNDNFMLADAKTLFESFPDRPIVADKHYNDLLNVEYTRGYDTAKMDWGRLWEGSSAASFWLDLATDYVSFSGIDIGGLAEDLIGQVIEKVIVPDVDPHPEEYGQYVLKRSFEDVLGIQELDRHTITYAANGASGSMAAQTVVGVDGLPAFVNLKAQSFVPATGYWFKGWNTSANGGGTSYADGQFINLTGNLTLYAQWSNIYTVVWRKVSNNEYISPSGETGPVTKDDNEYYLRATLDGVVLSGLRDKFDSDGVTQFHAKQVPYGTELHIQLINTGEKDRGAVYLNGNKVAGNSEYCYYTMPINKDTTIEFTWEQESILINVQSYWIAYINEFLK